jgi:hypothetical protein
MRSENAGAAGQAGQLPEVRHGEREGRAGSVGAEEIQRSCRRGPDPSAAAPPRERVPRPPEGGGEMKGGAPRRPAPTLPAPRFPPASTPQRKECRAARRLSALPVAQRAAACCQLPLPAKQGPESARPGAGPGLKWGLPTVSPATYIAKRTLAENRTIARLLILKML